MRQLLWGYDELLNKVNAVIDCGNTLAADDVESEISKSYREDKITYDDMVHLILLLDLVI